MAARSGSSEGAALCYSVPTPLCILTKREGTGKFSGSPIEEH